MLEILIAIATLSSILWLSTLFFYYRLRRNSKNLSVEAQDLLADILSSGAVIRLEVLDPKNLFYHRGR